MVHNASGWFAYTDYAIENGQFILNNVDTGDIDQIYLDFGGRFWGDVNGDGTISTADAFLMVKKRFNQVVFTENQSFYGDVNNDGSITTADAFLAVKKRFNTVDAFYQPL